MFWKYGLNLNDNSKILNATIFNLLPKDLMNTTFLNNENCIFRPQPSKKSNEQYYLFLTYSKSFSWYPIYLDTCFYFDRVMCAHILSLNTFSFASLLTIPVQQCWFWDGASTGFKIVIYWRMSIRIRGDVIKGS